MVHYWGVEPDAVICPVVPGMGEWSGTYKKAGPDTKHQGAGPDMKHQGMEPDTKRQGAGHKKHQEAGPDTKFQEVEHNKKYQELGTMHPEVWTCKALVGAGMEWDPDMESGPGNRVVVVVASQLSGHRVAVVVQWAWPEVWLGRWL